MYKTKNICGSLLLGEKGFHNGLASIWKQEGITSHHLSYINKHTIVFGAKRNSVFSKRPVLVCWVAYKIAIDQ
jgi:hypothetical protein